MTTCFISSRVRDINKLLSDLVEEGLLVAQETGRGTT